MKGIFNIEQLDEPIVIQRQKAEGVKLYKRIALFREMGERHGDVIMFRPAKMLHSVPHTSWFQLVNKLNY